ncbi:hypothetical protein, partial [Streptomyces murinus]
AALDAALHAIGLLPGAGPAAGPGTEGAPAGASAPTPLLPFVWTGVRLHALGAGTLRVRLTRADDAVAVSLADPAGQPVLSADGLVMRPVDPRRLAGLGQRSDALFTVDWTPVPLAAEPYAPGTAVALCHPG